MNNLKKFAFGKFPKFAEAVWGQEEETAEEPSSASEKRKPEPRGTIHDLKSAAPLVQARPGGDGGVQSLRSNHESLTLDEDGDEAHEFITIEACKAPAGSLVSPPPSPPPSPAPAEPLPALDKRQQPIATHHHHHHHHLTTITTTTLPPRSRITAIGLERRQDRWAACEARLSSVLPPKATFDVFAGSDAKVAVGPSTSQAARLQSLEAALGCRVYRGWPVTEVSDVRRCFPTLADPDSVSDAEAWVRYERAVARAFRADRSTLANRSFFSSDRRAGRKPFHTKDYTRYVDNVDLRHPRRVRVPRRSGQEPGALTPLTQPWAGRP